jgi:hypothetical protein
MTRTFAAAAALALAVAPDAAAQNTNRSVSEVLGFLLTNQSVSTGSVERDRAAAQAASDTVSRALLANLATLPVSSSSGAFAYRLNPELGTVERVTQTFPPFFVERALTVGRSTASLGFTYQSLRFSSLDGHSLRDGSLVTTANQFVDEPAPFDVDRLTLDINADVATVYGNLGIGDRAEIGFALPMVSLRLNGSRVNTYRGQTFTQASASATALGLADAVVRTKFTLFQEAGGAIAAAVDARLPTGRQDDLLGAGSVAVRASGIGSIEGSRASAHANLGFAFGGLAREVNYGGAIAAAASPRLTFTGELIGRVIDTAGHLESIVAPHPTLVDVETIRLGASTAKLHMLTVAPGVKWNVTDTWVLVGNVSVPVTKGGLTTTVTPYVGIDYSLER